MKRKRKKQYTMNKVFPIYFRNLAQELQDAIWKVAGEREKLQLQSYILTSIVIEGK